MNIAFENLEYIDSSSRFSGELQRVNVIMGANGSGKSKLLTAMAANLVSRGLENKPVYVEGGRPTQFNINTGLDSESIRIYNDPAGTERNYVSNRSSNLSVRMRDALRLLRALEQTRKSEHSDAVHTWMENGRLEEFPTRPKLPFEQFVEIFQSIFPDIKITLTTEGQIYANKSDRQYPVSAMSDGEKQIFMLAADLLSFRTDKQVFLIDEPELNLHPVLAERFWSLL